MKGLIIFVPVMGIYLGLQHILRASQCVTSELRDGSRPAVRKGPNMKSYLSTIILLLAPLFTAFAQYSSPFLKIDTVTAGNSDEYHPVFTRGLGWNDPEWLVFEHRTESSSAIAVKSLLNDPARWDSSMTIISAAPINQEQRLPSGASLRSYSGIEWVGWTLAAWQQKTNQAWNILYSLKNADSTLWSQPVHLTDDSISSTDVRVSSYNDSTFFVAWKKKNAILYTFLSRTSQTATDTLALSNEDSVEYDLAYSYSSGAVVWTGLDSNKNSIIMERTILSYPSFSLSPPESLFTQSKVFNPRFAILFVGYNGGVIYESIVNSKHQVNIWDGNSSENLSNDSSADCRNARIFDSPLVGSPPQSQLNRSLYWFDILIMEKYYANDSLLVFQRHWSTADTVVSTGYNRNASVGSSLYSLPFYGYLAVPIIWESNRSGRSHLYSRFALVPSGGVKERTTNAEDFELMQNYPNPFNPSTVIRFHVPQTANVVLKVYDMLGREVETLIDKKLTPGGYETTWDGRSCSSGVYFCRLQAGSLVQTRKLILLK